MEGCCQMMGAKRTQKGFTLIEILMVILLVSIIMVVAVPQFIDFQAQARNAATREAVAAIRSGINNQYAQMRLSCGVTNPATYPAMADIAANDITNGGSTCTTAQVAAAQRAFVQGTAVPGNPWSNGGTSNTIAACAGAATGCSRTDATNCAGAAFAGTEVGWCYNVATGEIWANTRLNGGTAGTTTEDMY